MKKLSGDGWEFIPAGREVSGTAGAGTYSGAQTVTLRIEKRAGGKVVTVIDGFRMKPDDLRALTVKLKKSAGTGGTAKEGAVELQGDQRDKLRPALEKMGVRVRG